MNVETNTGPDMNKPDVLDERIASVINTLITVADPRLVINALLGNAAALSSLVLSAGKATPAQVAHAFSGAMVDALTPREAPKEESRIQVVPAGVVPIKR